MSTALREVFARFRTQFDDRALKRGEEVTNRLTQSMKGLVASFAGLYAVGRIRSSITDFANMADEMGKTSRVIGISTQALQAWRHASNLSGVGAEAFNAGLIRLQRSMLDAQRGSATAVDAFRRLGVNVQDSSGQLRDADAVLRDMADPLANLESSSERVGILSTIMGRSGARMGPLFERGAEGIEAMTGELAEFGGGLSDETIAAAESYNDTLARMDLAFLSVKSRLATTLLPVLEDLAKNFTHLVKDTKILQSTLAVGVGLGALKAAKALQAMGTAGALAGAKTMASFGLLAAAIVVAILVVEDFLVFLEGGDSVIGGWVKSMDESVIATGHWIDAHKQADGVLGGLANTLDILSEAIERAGLALNEFLGTERFSPEMDPALRDAILERSGGRIDINTSEGRRAARRLRGASPEEIQAELDAIDARRGVGANLAGQGVPSFLASSDAVRALAAGQGGGAAPGAGVLPGVSARAANAIANQQVNVTINGGDPEETRRVVRKELDRSNRSLVDSLVSGVAAGEGI